MNATANNMLQTRASSINRALDQLGDKWCMLILQEIFWGVNTFNEILSASGMSRGVLSQRLNWLQEVDCLKKRPSQHGSRRSVYHLTKKSNDLYGVSLMATVWERQFFTNPALDHIQLQHLRCGEIFTPVMLCGSCVQPVTSDAVSYSDGPGAKQDLREKKVRRRSSISIMDAPNTRAVYKNLIHIAGDRWTANVVALAFHGLKKFDDFHRALPVATNILSDRLRFLVQEQIFSQNAYQQRPRRHEYLLTEKGAAMFPFFLGLLQWGDKWCGDGSGVPMIPHHDACGFDLRAQVCCDQCNQVLEAHDVSFLN